MSTFITVLHVMVCLFLMLTVLLQSGAKGGMGAAFGGGNTTSVFGGAGGSGFLRKLTAGAAATFMLTSMTLAFLATSGGSTDALKRFGAQQLRAKELKDAAREKALEETPGAGSATEETPGAGSAVDGVLPEGVLPEGVDMGTSVEGVEGAEGHGPDDGHDHGVTDPAGATPPAEGATAPSPTPTAPAAAAPAPTPAAPAPTPAAPAPTPAAPAPAAPAPTPAAPAPTPVAP